MILRLSYLHNGISYTGKMTFYIESIKAKVPVADTYTRLST